MKLDPGPGTGPVVDAFLTPFVCTFTAFVVPPTLPRANSGHVALARDGEQESKNVVSPGETHGGPAARRRVVRPLTARSAGSQTSIYAVAGKRRVNMQGFAVVIA